MNGIIEKEDNFIGNGNIRLDEKNVEKNNLTNLHIPTFVWGEDIDLPKKETTIFDSNNFDFRPLFPIVLVLLISTLIFIIIVYRRWPGLTAGIIAGFLTSISIYLLLLTLKQPKLVYE